MKFRGVGSFVRDTMVLCLTEPFSVPKNEEVTKYIVAGADVRITCYTATGYVSSLTLNAKVGFIVIISLYTTGL